MKHGRYIYYIYLKHGRYIYFKHGRYIFQTWQIYIFQTWQIYFKHDINHRFRYQSSRTFRCKEHWGLYNCNGGVINFFNWIILLIVSLREKWHFIVFKLLNICFETLRLYRSICSVGKHLLKNRDKRRSWELEISQLELELYFRYIK